MERAAGEAGFGQGITCGHCSGRQWDGPLEVKPLLCTYYVPYNDYIDVLLHSWCHCWCVQGWLQPLLGVRWSEGGGRVWELTAFAGAALEVARGLG